MGKGKVANSPFHPFPTDSPKGLAGILYKQGDLTKQWNTRYFLLQDNLLIHFNDPQADKPSRILKLSDCEVGSEVTTAGGKYSITVKAKYLGDRVYVLGTDNKDKANNWLNALRDSREFAINSRSAGGSTMLPSASAKAAVVESIAAAAEYLPENVKNLLRDGLHPSKENGWELVDADDKGTRIFQDNSSEKVSSWSWFKRHVLGQSLASIVLFSASFAGINYVLPDKYAFASVLFLHFLSLLSWNRALKSKDLPYKPSVGILILAVLNAIIAVTFPSIAWSGAFAVVSIFASFFIWFFFSFILERPSKVTFSTVVNYSPEILSRAILDLEARSRWDPQLQSSLLRLREPARRIMRWEYKSSDWLKPQVIEAEEQWFSISARSFVLVVRPQSEVSTSSNDPNSKSYFVDDSDFEAACLIRPLKSQDTDIFSRSLITLTSNASISWPFSTSLPRNLCIKTIHGVTSYLSGLPELQLQAIRDSALGGDIEQEEMKKASIAEEKKFREELRQVCEILKKEIAGGEELGYKQVMDNGKTQIYRKTNLPSASAIAIKAVSKLNAPLKLLINYIGEVTTKPNYDIMCAKAYVLRSYSDITKVIRQEYRAFWPISARDFVSVATLFPMENGSFLLATKSIDYSEMPDAPGYVRAHIEFGGYLFEVLDGGRATRITFVASSDMKQALPGFIVDLASQNQGLQLEKINSLVDKIDAASVRDESYIYKAIADLEGIDVKELEEKYKYTGKDSTPGDEKGYEAPSASRSSESSAESIANASIDELIHAADDQFADEWEFITEDSQVKIYKKKISASDAAGAPLITKGVGIIEALPLQILGLMSDIPLKPQWDAMFEEGKVLETIDETIQVAYQKFKAIWPVSARDFVSANTFKILPDGTVIGGGKNCVHPSCPEIRGVVRGNLVLGGMVAKPLPNSDSGTPRTLVTYVAGVDLRGTIPSSLLKIISVKQPLIVDAMRKALVKIGVDKFDIEEMRKRHDAKWGTKSTVQVTSSTKAGSSEKPTAKPQLKASDSKEAGSKSAELKKSDSQTETIHEEAGSTLSSRTSMDIPSITEVDEKEEDLRFALISRANYAMATLLEASDPKGGWSFLFEKQGVQVSQRSFGVGKPKVTKGEGIVTSSPLDVAGIVACLSRKKWYDEMLLDDEQVCQVDARTNVHHQVYQSRDCRGSARDFVILSHWERFTDGKIVVAYTSVDHPDVPASKLITRGDILIAGWIIEPLSQGKSSKVTYLSQVDLKGSLPGWATALLVKQQPLLVAQVQRLFVE